MIRTHQTCTAKCVSRVKAWLSADQQPRLKIAQQSGVDEKTLRLALEQANWNPTAKTLIKLETIIPKDFQPKNGRA